MMKMQQFLIWSASHPLFIIQIILNSNRKTIIHPLKFKVEKKKILSLQQCGFYIYNITFAKENIKCFPN